MTTIATLDEFAYAIRRDSAAAAKHQLLLDLAEGLVIEELGVLTTYPVSAKAVVLEASARAYFSLLATQQLDEIDREEKVDLKAAQLGVYLTEDEVKRIHGRVATGPRFSFPGTWPYPDPVERTPDTISFGDTP